MFHEYEVPTWEIRNDIQKEMKCRVYIEIKEANEGSFKVRHIHIRFPLDFFISHGETLVFSPYNLDEISLIPRPDNYCFECDNTYKIRGPGSGPNGSVFKPCPMCQAPKQSKENENPDTTQ